ncbi:hypothetical protein Tsubulata_040433 [Turnera subulata]|uniref:Mitochondrial glycoprotein n=1 Tax=Turnera subulata TaxID=218843 RepID=A0A9Q0GCY0_9ROSI|nr:hypothetical protein Tsubulata_040433 [Turnera subulata]
MALNSVLRIASKSVVPLAIRAAGSPRCFHGAVPAVLLTVEKHRIGRQISPRNFVPCPSSAAYSSQTSDANLVRVLESEIDCADKPEHDNNFPARFPFEINDNLGERTVTLSRRFQDEIIKVEVDMPNVDDEEDEDDDENDEDDDEAAGGDNLPLVVKITKGSGEYLEFGITAFADEITIDSLSVKNPNNADDQLAYEGPNFEDLDDNLQKAFYKYLDARGINPHTTNVLFEYMTNKDSREYLQWLQNLKNFVEK